LVLLNFGIAIAARMPMITTTISSSMRVKPLRFILPPDEAGVGSGVAWCGGGHLSTPALARMEEAIDVPNARSGVNSS